MIRGMIRTFLYVTAGITISAAIFIGIFGPEYLLNCLFLWEIIIMAAVSTLGNLIYYSKKELSKKQMVLRMFLHYLYTNMIVIGFSFYWGWLKRGTFMQILVMVVLIGLVYGGVTMLMFHKEEKTARDLNRRLSKNNNSEEGY